MTELNLAATSLIAVGIAVVACATDVRSRRIPNFLTFGAAAAGLIYAAWDGGTSGLSTAMLGWLAGLLLFLPIFLLGGMGAGDVKLLAALGAWLGPFSVFWIAIYASLAGGVLGIGVALLRGYLRTALTNIVALVRYWLVAGFRPAPGLTLDSSAAPRLAYAIPILIGTVVTLWTR
jgi:prepilin peptidase CpaA